MDLHSNLNCLTTANSDANQKSQSGDIWLDTYSACGAAAMACFSKEILDVEPWCSTQASIALDGQHKILFADAKRILRCPSKTMLARVLHHGSTSSISLEGKSAKRILRCPSKPTNRTFANKVLLQHGPELLAPIIGWTVLKGLCHAMSHAYSRLWTQWLSQMSLYLGTAPRAPFDD